MTDPSEMTDAELLEAVAFELLGAAEVSQSRESSQVEWFEKKRPSKGLHRLALDWRGIGMVVEVMHGRNIWMKFDGVNDHVMFWDKPGQKILGSSRADDPARAVMEAALAAKRSVGG